MTKERLTLIVPDINFPLELNHDSKKSVAVKTLVKKKKKAALNTPPPPTPEKSPG